LGKGRAGGKAAADSDAARRELYAGLGQLQLSYVASLTGHSLRAANAARKSASLLGPLRGAAEADAALSLYDYYKASLLKGFDWLPFLRADMDGPVRRLENALSRSRYLREVLQTSLLWLYYDEGRFGEGLALIRGFLSRYPGNRLYRQILGDYHFRSGSLDSARAVQESLLAEYSAMGAKRAPPGCLPLGYLSAVGNLVKIHSALGQEHLRRKYLVIWSESGFREVMPWLPASLRREVKALEK